MVDTLPSAGSKRVVPAVEAVRPADGVVVRSMKSVQPPKLDRVTTHVPTTVGATWIEVGALVHAETAMPKSLRFEKVAPVVVSERGVEVPLEMETQTPPATLVLAQSVASTAKPTLMPGVAATTL